MSNVEYAHNRKDKANLLAVKAAYDFSKNVGLKGFYANKSQNFFGRVEFFF